MSETPGRKQMTSVRLEPDLLAAMRARAADDGTDITTIIRTALLEYMGECPTCHQPVTRTIREGQP